MKDKTTKTVILIANSDGALYMFRKTLIEELVERNHKVISVSGHSVEGEYSERLRSIGVMKHHEISFSGSSINPLSFLKLILTIIKIYKEHNPDIVHCFTHKACISGAIARKIINLEARLIFTITGLGRVFSELNLRNIVLRSLIEFQYRLVCNSAHKVFFQNKDDAELFINKCNLKKNKVRVVGGSGVDLSEMKCESRPSKIPSKLRKLGIDSKKIVILKLGRGMIQKGFFEFYSAAKEISISHPNKYLFIHAGNIDNEIYKKIGSDELENFARAHCVKFLGFRKEVKDLLLFSDVVVHPSYYREGVPRSLIEALAMDKPIITCETIGNKETVKDGWNGFFCEPRSVKSLISKILLANKDFILDSKGRSRILAESKFDVRIINKNVRDMYFNKI